MLAAGQAMGLTAEATAAQHPRPEVAHRPVGDAPPVSVLLAWWVDSPPAELESFLRLVRDEYAGRR